ncbi:hypothetical protein O3M35_000895 [Rhynocoris fuscipes]|uniref:Uncharacterized protein n=1 Tax=Rhynocoris fuscipes TaxID=488301 RepID=A0AAW1DN60_9HEMI
MLNSNCRYFSPQHPVDQVNLQAGVNYSPQPPFNQYQSYSEREGYIVGSKAGSNVGQSSYYNSPSPFSSFGFPSKPFGSGQFFQQFFSPNKVPTVSANAKYNFIQNYPDTDSAQYIEALKTTANALVNFIKEHPDFLTNVDTESGKVSTVSNPVKQISVVNPNAGKPTSQVDLFKVYY